MLALGRHEGESVILYDPAGDRIATITVTRIKDKTAILGILAPPAIRIVRHELVLKGVQNGKHGS